MGSWILMANNVGCLDRPLDARGRDPIRRSAPVPGPILPAPACQCPLNLQTVKENRLYDPFLMRLRWTKSRVLPALPGNQWQWTCAYAPWSRGGLRGLDFLSHHFCHTPFPSKRCEWSLKPNFTVPALFLRFCPFLAVWRN